MSSSDEFLPGLYREMPTLLASAPAALPTWAVGAPKSKNAMTLYGIQGKDNYWPSVQLVEKERMGEITVPFEPSVFRGTGTEPRKGIIFTVPQDVLENMRKIEEWAQKQVPSATWHSCLKEPGSYSGSVKAKINVSGANACSIVDLDGKPAEWPENWARIPVIPILDVRGIYKQATGSGLILDVTHLMVGEPAEPTRECDFL